MVIVGLEIYLIYLFLQRYADIKKGLETYY